MIEALDLSTFILIAIKVKGQAGKVQLKDLNEEIASDSDAEKYVTDFPLSVTISCQYNTSAVCFENPLPTPGSQLPRRRPH